eukprot:635553-Ditylum_brightwellii.AAC.1
MAGRLNYWFNVGFNPGCSDVIEICHAPLKLYFLSCIVSLLLVGPFISCSRLRACLLSSLM